MYALAIFEAFWCSSSTYLVWASDTLEFNKSSVEFQLSLMFSLHSFFFNLVGLLGASKWALVGDSF